MRFFIAITIISSLASAVCLTFAARSHAFVDPNGIPVEPFAWAATGQLLLVVAMATGIAVAWLWLTRRKSASS